MNNLEPDNQTVHGLWIGEQLSAPEILCIRSFQRAGHTFQLWTYGPVANIPEGTLVGDAGTIIPKEAVFSYRNTNKFGHGKGSYAGFSDIFRYRLLYLRGGWWTDMDITCLKPLQIADAYVFRLNGEKGIVGNLMKCPPNSDLMRDCYERAIATIGADNRDWLLPIRILNEGIQHYGLGQHCRTMTNIDSWPTVSRYIIGQPAVPENWYAIHWMNEEWRRCGLDKQTFIEGSMIESLLNEYGVPHATYPPKEAMRLRFKLGRLNYILINLVASAKWWTRFILSGGKRETDQ